MCCLFLFYTYHQHEILTKLFKYLTVNKTGTEIDVWAVSFQYLLFGKEEEKEDEGLQSIIAQQRWGNVVDHPPVR